MANLNGDSWLIVRVYIALETLVTLSVVCRFFARHRKSAPIRWDDAWAVFGWINYTVYVGLVMKSVALGSAQTMYVLPSFENLVRISKLEYAAAILFETANIASKISLLCLYRRIFSTSGFQRWSLVVLGLCISWYVASILVTIFQCLPVYQTWNPLAVTGVDRTCIDINGFIIGYETSNMLCDVVILCLPVRMIQTLQLSRSQKALLRVIFLLGGFVCITSILRIIYTNHQDTRDYFINTRLWSGISVASSIISATLPVLRPLLPSNTRVTGWYRKLGGFMSYGSARTWGSTDHHNTAGGFNADPTDLSTRKYEVIGGKARKWPGFNSDITVQTDEGSGLSAYPLHSIRVDRTLQVEEARQS